jgi:hypothetical protein
MARFRTLLLAAALVIVGLAAVPASAVSAVSAAAVALPGGASHYVSVDQRRIVDTRAAPKPYGFVRLGTNNIRVKVAGLYGVPASATAVVVNITATGGTRPGFITAFATGTPRTQDWDVVTDVAGQSLANLVTVKVGSRGSIDVTHTTGQKLTIDIVGAYTPVAGPVAAGRIRLMDRTVRAATRLPFSKGATKIIDTHAVGVPFGASAVIVNLTTDQPGKGFWTAYRWGTHRPPTSAVQVSYAGRSMSNELIVAVNPNSPKIAVYSSGGGLLTVTVVGWYTGATDPVSTVGLYVPSTAHRRLDTRRSRILAPIGPLTVEFPSGVGIAIMGVAVNVTSLAAWDAGSVYARPAGTAGAPVPLLTVGTPRQSVSAHGLLRVSTRGVALVSPRGSHLVVDVVGWFLGPRPVATLAVPKVPALRATKVVGVIWHTASGTHSRAVATPSTTANTNLNPIADSGNGASYLARSTLGQMGNVMVFGHRTVHGAMFRDLNTTPLGAEFVLVGADGKRYHYRVVSKTVTGPSYRTISAITLRYPPITAQLVACSKPDGTPTNVNYRIVITGMLVAVT